MMEERRQVDEVVEGRRDAVVVDRPRRQMSNELLPALRPGVLPRAAQRMRKVRLDIHLSLDETSKIVVDIGDRIILGLY